MSDKNLSRRKFLSGAIAAGAALTGCARGPMVVPRGVLGGPGYIPPSQKVRIAKVGCGGQGNRDFQGIADQAIIALCDVDLKRAEKIYYENAKVPMYRDFRRMLDKHDNDIDAVMISTPDHTHYVIAMDAISRGKHVYVQKPLTWSIGEARRLRAAARKAGVVTQMGNQGHAGDGVRQLMNMVRGDALGPIREVTMWTNRPIWPQGPELTRLPAQAVPDSMSWDLWLGPAPERAYNEKYAPFNWRGWWDFGTGALGDMGCHVMDPAFWTLDIASARTVKVSAVAEPFNDEAYPNASVITYEVSERNGMPPVTLKWFDGNKLPPRPAGLPESRKLPQSGSILIGDKAGVMTETYGESPRIFPEEKMEDYMASNPTDRVWRSPGVYSEWVEACRGGAMPGSNFEYSVPLTEFVLLGNIAMKLGKTVTYDMVEGRFTDNKEANELLDREPRKGWEA